ncbi:hypothetical protein RIR_jg39582.t1 [Rhizophagus irregularis DAOM 181602=DAOM 197198]|nr:hypothetical protein RIR_jg39582.t1 [Rhizophagus irregularis DAOM 181602=DAOM 197198]
MTVNPKSEYSIDNSKRNVPVPYSTSKILAPFFMEKEQIYLNNLYTMNIMILRLKLVKILMNKDNDISPEVFIIILK